MARLSGIFFLALFLGSCSTGQLSRYEQGDLHTRKFLNLIGSQDDIHGDYYEVKRNQKGWITSARHFSSQRHLLEKSNYTYSRKGQLRRHHLTEYFEKGPPRISREWIYHNGRVVQREERWFTRTRTLEKKLVILYDAEGKPYLEETLGLGRKIESSTEYYYDYKHRLDKSRRNFFYPDGNLRDYWLTIYNDQIKIVTEEHYLSDNSLLAFYRYSYHPVQGYREQEEIFDEMKKVFIIRKFNEFGLLVEETESSPELKLQKRTVYEYNAHQIPKFVYHYNASGKLVKKTRYKELQSLGSFRTPKN